MNNSPAPVDFSEYRPVMDIAMERIKRSVPMHGDWLGYGPKEVFEAVADEFDEYREAFLARKLTGEHGQVYELIDILATASKGVRQLLLLSRLRFTVRSAMCGDPGKVWLTCETGEGDDFCRAGFEAAMRQGLAEGDLNGAIDRFFWENF